jgi:hypothetical protein
MHWNASGHGFLHVLVALDYGNTDGYVKQSTHTHTHTHTHTLSLSLSLSLSRSGSVYRVLMVFAWTLRR